MDLQAIGNLMDGLLSGPDGAGYLISLVVLLVGLGYFLFPGIAMKQLRLEGAVQHPEAVGEARSSFAGFLVATGALVLLAQAATMQFALALSLAIAALGKFVHIVFDGSRRKGVFVRFAILALMAAVLLPTATLATGRFALPQTTSELLPAISAVIACVFGLISFFAPQIALNVMRLRPVGNFVAARGEVRGTLAGFYLGVGLSVLVLGGFHGALLIGCAWLATAFGRMISMLSDRSNNIFNWISLMLELVLALLPFSVILGLLG